jgi:hypothetical protein
LGKSLLTATYLLNRSPTNAVKGMNPYEVWRNEKPNIKHFKVCLVVPPMCRTPKGERDKFDLMGKKCIFFGYGNVTKGYRMNNQQHLKVFLSRDVISNKIEKSQNDSDMQLIQEKKDSVELKGMDDPVDVPDTDRRSTKTQKTTR